MSVIKTQKVKQIISVDLKGVFKKMVIIRKFEELCAKLYRESLIGGFCHLYIGQEAVLTATDVATTNVDSIITAYRCHPHAFIRSDKQAMAATLAELLGRDAGVSRGKGGSMHLFDVEHNVFGGHGIVGASSSLGTGLAFAHKYKGDGGACLAFFGDGAFNQGQVYESMNMAKIWGLPIVYVIENNLYAMGTSTKRGSANYTKLFTRGEGFGINGYQVDGMDFFAVYEVMKNAITECKGGNPVLLEILTYRYRGHSMSDPGKYRTREEVNDMIENRDPIANLGRYMLGNKIATEKELGEIERICEEEIEFCYNFAVSSPEPDLKELYTDIMS